MKEITTKILKLEPTTLGLIFLLFPLISLLINGMISVISLFTNSEFIFPLFEISISIIVLIYLIWVWGVVYYVEEKEITNTIYFKICYWVYFSYCLIMFIDIIGLDITKKEFLLENRTWEIIGNVAGFYTLLVFISYAYISYFVGKKIKALEEGHPKSMFFYFAAVWAFPVGIPFFLQAKLLRKNSLFDQLSSFLSNILNR